MTMRTPNSLHVQLARQILVHVRSSGFEPGHHLTEQALQNVLGTSRAPIRAALSVLAERGHLEKLPNRGFFLRNGPTEDLGAAIADETDDAVYFQIVDDRLAGALPEAITENEAMRRYDLSRSRLRRIFDRISREGWIQRRDGHGWQFLPVIDSVEAYRENYELREMLEPQGFSSSTFRVDQYLLEGLRLKQEFIRDSGWRTLGQVELVETNAQFHEGLAAMSGNRFLMQAITRQNQLRRLVEYRQVTDRDRVRQQVREHLQIVATLLDGDRKAAADLLRKHLVNARISKAVPEVFAAMKNREATSSPRAARSS